MWFYACNGAKWLARTTVFFLRYLLLYVCGCLCVCVCVCVCRSGSLQSEASYALQVIFGQVQQLRYRVSQLVKGRLVWLVPMCSCDDKLRNPLSFQPLLASTAKSSRRSV